MKKLLSLGTSISVLALLTACSGQDRGHEIALNQATGIEVTQGPNGVELRLPEKVLFDFNKSDLRADSPHALARAVVLLNGLYKTELIHRRAPWKTRESVELATLEWVAWYNHHRLMEPLGYIPPAEAEATYYRQLRNAAEVPALT